MAAAGDSSQLEVEKVLIPLGRICEPMEAAALIHFLVADDCQFINGQAINLCGGMSAGLGPSVWDALAGQLGGK
jgi:NAD(P)-dependent dehydrogenase (short-subunit alcohol dehydrogenase family)